MLKKTEMRMLLFIKRVIKWQTQYPSHRISKLGFYSVSQTIFSKSRWGQKVFAL